MNKVGRSMSQTKDKVTALQQDASRVLKEISELSVRLREVGKEKMGEVSDDTVSMLKKQLSALQAQASNISEESKELLKSVDKSVRANPYTYILGALGLGLLLGKWFRSRR